MLRVPKSRHRHLCDRFQRQLVRRHIVACPSPRPRRTVMASSSPSPGHYNPSHLEHQILHRRRARRRRTGSFSDRWPPSPPEQNPTAVTLRTRSPSPPLILRAWHSPNPRTGRARTGPRRQHRHHASGGTRYPGGQRRPRLLYLRRLQFRQGAHLGDRDRHPAHLPGLQGRHTHRPVHRRAANPGWTKSSDGTTVSHHTVTSSSSDSASTLVSKVPALKLGFPGLPSPRPAVSPRTARRRATTMPTSPPRSHDGRLESRNQRDGPPPPTPSACASPPARSPRQTRRRVPQRLRLRRGQRLRARGYCRQSGKQEQDHSSGT